jgi:hypothetical protein
LRENPVGTPGKTLAVNSVAAIDVTTGAPVSAWKPGVTNNDGTRSEVRALEVWGGKVYIGGNFAAVGGQPRRNLAAVDAATGTVSPFSATVGDSTSLVYALAADASRLYVGGTFARVNGAIRGKLAAVDRSSGALDTAWTPETNKIVRKLEFDPSGATIFAVGGFNSATGSNGVKEARQSVARFETNSGNLHPWAAPAGAIGTDSSRNGNMTCWTVTVTPTRLYVGCGLGPNFAVGLRLDNGNTGTRVWRLWLLGNPVSSAISPDGSRLILGGHFGINSLDQRVCDGRYLKGLVALDPVAAESVGAARAIDCSWIPSLDQKSRPDYDGAWDLTTGGNRLWVGGGFTGVSGVPQSNLARFTYDPTLP